MNTFIKFIETIYNSIRFNGFYILLSLLFPYILWKLDAGSEIIISMRETTFVPNIILSLAAFLALALSVWCIPTLGIKLFLFATNYVEDHSPEKKQEVKLYLFKQLIFAYNGISQNDHQEEKGDEKKNENGLNKRKQIPIRYLAIAPWVLFILTIIKVFLHNAPYQWLIVLAGLGFNIFVIWFIDNNKVKVVELFGNSFKPGKKDFHAMFYHLLFIAGILAVMISWAWFYHKNRHGMGAVDTSYSEWVMILLHLFVLQITYGYLVYMENVKLEPKHSYLISNIGFRLLGFFLIMCIVWLYLFNENQLIRYVSPINVIIIISATFIVFFELLFTSQHHLIAIARKGHYTLSVDPSKKVVTDASGGFMGYKLFLIAFLLFFIVKFFFFSVNSHRIRVVESNPQVNEKRSSLTDYFDHWLKSRNLGESEDSIVYLISGQGGGSRAGAHFYITMALLEVLDPCFFEKVFCISTASGSSSGAEMFLGSKYCNVNYTDTAFVKQKAIELYGVNYMSSAFFGMMLGEGIECDLFSSGAFPHDRNYHLQKEELDAFLTAFPNDSTKATEYFESDFMLTYSDNKHWPLFMVNSTIIDYGVRAIFSPVITDFSLARDLYGNFIKDNTYHDVDLPLVTCVNQSQAFPVISAYNYMECSGRMGDGGIVENTGCSTTLEVYKALRQYCYFKNYKKVKIVCININNSKIDERFDAPFQKASILNTVTAAMNSPFEGAEFYAHSNLANTVDYLNRFNLDINNLDTVLNFDLGKEVTLTRTLSKKEVKNMFEIINQKIHKFHQLMK